MIAAKLKIDVETMITKVSGGPTFKGTVAEANKFHDDKSLYTGVYAQGGPTNVDSNTIHDLSMLADRSAANVRGSKLK